MIPRLYPVFDRAGAVQLPATSRFFVDNISKSEIGGCKRATIRAVGSRADLPALQQMVNYLGAGVRIYSGSAELRWWGFINEIVISSGAVSFGVSFEQMANSVAVGYTDYKGQRATLAAAENAASVGRWGRKQKLVALSDANSSAAYYRQQSELYYYATPQGVASFDRDDSGQVVVTMQCAGYWDRLDWEYYTNPGGVHEHAVGGGEQNLGEGSDIQRVSQVLTIPESSVAYEYVTLPMKRVGTPVDGIIVELRDGATHGSGTLLATANIVSANISTTAVTDVTAQFSPTYTQSGAGQTNLTVYRGSSSDISNYYVLGVDASVTYSGGTMQIRTGAATWGDGTPKPADMQFRLTGDITTTDQINNALLSFVSQRVVEGVIIEQASDVQTVPYRNGDNTCRNEIEMLLEKSARGTSKLLAEVTADRWLRVYVEPASATYYVNEQGQLETLWGAPVDKSTCPAGVRAKLRNVFPTIEASVNFSRYVEFPIAEAEYSVQYDETTGDPVGDDLRFIPRGASDPFQFEITAHP